MGWKRVTARRPCPICDKPDWCTISDDGTLACCMRAKSDHVAGNGGYIHPLTSSVSVRYAAPSTDTNISPDCDVEALLHRYAEDVEWYQVVLLGRQLGVSPQSLESIGVGWSDEHQAYTFPMFSHQNVPIGIRLRSSDGHKWAVSGSRNGILKPRYPLFAERLPTANSTRFTHGKSVLVVCEGESDLAVLLDWGIHDAIARPSCSGARSHIRKMCEHNTARYVVIIADNDSPGLDGAFRLQEHLEDASIAIKSVVVLPGEADLRNWKLSGATVADLLERIEQAGSPTPYLYEQNNVVYRPVPARGPDGPARELERRSVVEGAPIRPRACGDDAQQAP
jgi:5S rRNA maturation endonuclease (ribonuclease M5)